MNNVPNATRLERQNQRARERVAKRGHKLLKDKSSEMARHMRILEKEALVLRDRVEGEFSRAIRYFMTARAFMSSQEITNAIKSARVNFNFKKSSQNIMGLVVPKLDIYMPEQNEKPMYITTHESFDRAVQIIQTTAPLIVELGCKEKAVEMLRREIETLRRRINALEHNVIPKIQSNIRYITFKLSENERGNLVRLMKVKEMHEKQND